MFYTDENRGKVQSDRAGQIIEFAGMKYGNSTPTDIDGFIEKHNEAFVFFELKYRGAKMPVGQRMALVRLVDNLRDNGKKAVLFVGKHDVADPTEKVMAANAEVTEIYYNGVWYKDCGGTLKEMIDRFMRWALPF